MRAIGAFLFISMILATFHASPALAMGKSISHEEFNSTCTKIAREGMPEYRQVNWEEIDGERPTESSLRLELPLVFHVVNHQGGFLGSNSISERELNVHLASLRDAYNGCGLAVLPEEIHYWDAPTWMDTISRNPNTHQMSDEERCLFRGTHREGRINVYFVESVTGIADAYAHANYWFEPGQPGDERFVSSAMVSDLERLGYGQRVSARHLVVAHEVGHPLMNTSHTFNREPNLMSDFRESMALSLNAGQCERARKSRFVRAR
jgi:hypothetical protein